MKLRLIPLSLFSISALIPLLPSFTPVASAACVMTDVGVQVAVHGSRTPAEQINTVDMQHADTCMGSVTTNVGEQIYVGPGPVEQIRDSHHYVGGGSDDYQNLNTPIIGVPVGVPVDVYAPAYDPSFYGNLPYAGSDFYPDYGYSNYSSDDSSGYGMN